MNDNPERRRKRKRRTTKQSSSDEVPADDQVVEPSSNLANDEAKTDDTKKERRRFMSRFAKGPKEVSTDSDEAADSTKVETVATSNESASAASQEMATAKKRGRKRRTEGDVAPTREETEQKSMKAITNESVDEEPSEPTKKKKRRRRRVEIEGTLETPLEDETAPETPPDETEHNDETVLETSLHSDKGEQPESSLSRNRKKRRKKSHATDPSSEPAPESLVDIVAEKEDVQTEESEIGPDKTDEVHEKKRTRKRKKKKAAGAEMTMDSSTEMSKENTAESISTVDLDESSTAAEFEEVNIKDEDEHHDTVQEGESLPTSTVTIDTAIEIPNEEIVSEIIFSKLLEVDDSLTALEVDGAADQLNKEQPLEDTLQDSLQASEDLPTSAVSMDAAIEIPSEEVVPESIFSKLDVDDSLATSDEDYEAQTQVPSIETLTPENIAASPEVDDSTSNGQSTEFDDFPSDIVSIEAAIEVPSEEVVPKSIFSTVEVDHNLQEFDANAEDEMLADAKSDDEVVDQDDVLIGNLDEPKHAPMTCLELDQPEEISVAELDADESVEGVGSDALEDASEVSDTDKTAVRDGKQEREDTKSMPYEVSTVHESSLTSDKDITVKTPVPAGEETSTAVNELLSTLTEDKLSESMDASEDSNNALLKIETDETATNMDNECLKLSIITWNLGEAAPSEKEASFIRRFRSSSDLVLVGAQECEDIKPRRSEGHRSRHLRRLGIQMLGEDYVPIVIHSLGGIQAALYCRREKLGDVEFVSIADVTCGVGNVFHNKGAIGVYLKMRHRSSGSESAVKSCRILLVTGHLAAHVKHVDSRNLDFKRIMVELEAQAPARFLRPKLNRDGSIIPGDGSHLLTSMDHVFFSGDLNYRVDLPREYVDKCIEDIQKCRAEEPYEKTAANKEIDVLMNKLLRRDQLLQTIASGRAFAGFSEAKIAFYPTFKFDKGTPDYDTSHKQRIPAWTDRILFKSSDVRVLEYDSVPKAMHSDHRPVYGTFQLGWGSIQKTKSKPKKHSRSKRTKNDR
jgi:phosphatidylinositol-bisphosphatase